ncbi:MAG: tyrosine-protein phosphatase [Nocardioidaceae bacterium]
MRPLVPNLRDLGNTPAGEGALVRPGVLLRSAAPLPGDATPDGVPWPPAQVLDLRSPLESGATHPLEGAGAIVRQVSLLEALRPDGPQSADQETVERMRTGGLENLYLGMLRVAADRLVEVLTRIADGEEPTLVHCAAGKDRTGVVVALALRAVGVTRERVVADYLESGKAMGEVVRRLAQMPGVDPHKPPPKSYLALPSGAIEAVLDVWDGHDGGVEGWLIESGADDDLVRRLRRRLVRP